MLERRAVGKLGAQVNSYSQAGQDRFVRAVHGDTPGFFLDVGCSDPVHISNTYALEKLGWRGLLVDISPELATNIQMKRASPFLCADATTIDWIDMVDRYRLPKVIDYLSFDLDNAGSVALPRLPWSLLRFRVLTIEHDAYRLGNGPRQAMRALLRDHGYDLLCPDVCNDGFEFEDWWVDSGLVDMRVAGRFRTTMATPWETLLP